MNRCWGRNGSSHVCRTYVRVKVDSYPALRSFGEESNDNCPVMHSKKSRSRISLENSPGSRTLNASKQWSYLNNKCYSFKLIIDRPETKSYPLNSNMYAFLLIQKAINKSLHSEMTSSSKDGPKVWVQRTVSTGSFLANNSYT
jgi:hypothetical protein